MTHIPVNNKLIYLRDYHATPRTVLVAWKPGIERAAIADGLGALGFQVQLASTSEVAWEQLEDAACKIAVFDTELEDMDSIDVIKTWNVTHAGNGHVQIVYVGSGGEHQRKSMGFNGVYRFLRKPVSPSEIIKTIASIHKR
jgi:DNA-binding response OmpR family regulator